MRSCGSFDPGHRARFTHYFVMFHDPPPLPAPRRDHVAAEDDDRRENDGQGELVELGHGYSSVHSASAVSIAHPCNAMAEIRLLSDGGK